jgi:ADP-ribose pyrophosphatase YjhB (NUDIX family)
VIDGNRWTLPDGWTDVTQTPTKSVVREVFEASGYRVRAVKGTRGMTEQRPEACNVFCGRDGAVPL